MIRAADLFCGAGGASLALSRVCARVGVAYDLVAVNHWPTAVRSHSANHPAARHLCERVETVLPREAVPGGRLDLLMAGPSCVHHSRARGGRPVNEQDRASAWCVLRWLSELQVERVIIENVAEFREWGPVGVDGRPMRSRRGQTYQAWLEAIRSLGYRVEDRVLNAADFGDPTTRTRLWVLARRGRGAIEWPSPTHSRDGGRHLFGSTERWRPARDVIDWSIEGRSIFDRKRPLSPRTMARIEEGLRRFSGPDLEPYLVVLRNHMSGRSLQDPVPTLAASGEHIGLAVPFLMHSTHGGRVRSIGDPLPTVTGANRGEMALVSPFILQQQSGGAPRAVTQPLPTIAASGAQALVEPFLVPLFGERAGQCPRVHSVDEPLPTVTATKGGPALVEPIISAYYGTGHGATPISEPLPTVTARDRFGLVVPEVHGRRLDIRFRMLQPHELAAAMSFGPGYSFTGTKTDQVRQIGNAWPVRLGEALVEAQLAAAFSGRRVAHA